MNTNESTSNVIKIKNKKQRDEERDEERERERERSIIKLVKKISF